jgi:tetratricopeptide (TPR) repeat protein
LTRGTTRRTCARVRAQGLLDGGKPRDAAAVARALVQSNADDVEARALYAVALSAAGQGSHAKAFLRESFKRMGYLPDLVIARATIGVREDQPNLRVLLKAVKMCKRVHKPLRVLADLYALLGRAYYRLGENGHAGAAFDDTLRLNRHHPQANYYQGILFTEQDQLEQARRMFTAATQARPSVPMAWYELGKLGLRIGDPEAARHAYAEYLKAEPEGDYADEAKKQLAALALRSGTR